MRRYCITLSAVIVALVLLLQIGCQEQAKAPDEAEAALVAAEPAPKIKFDKVVYDFGEVAARKKYAAEFKFTNTGDGSLKITEVKVFRKFSRIPRHWQPLNTRTCPRFFGGGGSCRYTRRGHARIFASKSSFFAENGLLVAGNLSLFPPELKKDSPIADRICCLHN